MASEFDKSNTEKAIAAILSGEQVPVKSRAEQVIQDIIDGKEVTPRSRIEARLCNIGTGGSSGETLITDLQYTAMMNEIFGEGNWV